MTPQNHDECERTSCKVARQLGLASSCGLGHVSNTPESNNQWQPFMTMFLTSKTVQKWLSLVFLLSVTRSIPACNWTIPCFAGFRAGGVYSGNQVADMLECGKPHIQLRKFGLKDPLPFRPCGLAQDVIRLCMIALCRSKLTSNSARV